MATPIFLIHNPLVSTLAPSLFLSGSFGSVSLEETFQRINVDPSIEQLRDSLSKFKSHPTGSSCPFVGVLKKDAVFRQIFESFNEPLKNLSHYFGDICQMAEEWSEDFLALMRVEDDLFPVNVLCSRGRPLSIGVHDLSYDFLFEARYKHKIVLPQLNTADDRFFERVFRPATW